MGSRLPYSTQDSSKVVCPLWAIEKHLDYSQRSRVGFWGESTRNCYRVSESWRIGELLIEAMKVRLLGRRAGWRKRAVLNRNI